MNPNNLSRFESRWLAQAISEIERTDGRLADYDEVRQATAEASDPEGQIVARGVLLADREGLVDKLNRWLSISRSLMLVLAVLIFFAGIAAALGFDEGSRQINALWALLGLLGSNLLMLAVWAYGFFSSGRRHIGVGALWPWVISHFPGQSDQLVQPLITLHDKSGLTRWWFGSMTHGVWAVATLGMLAGLVGALAFRGYTFVWETTWLTQDTLVWMVQFFGIAPAMIGFPVPDASVVSLSNVPLTDEAARRAWTAWFVGCLTVYGLLPRLLLWLMCWMRLTAGRRKLRLDPADRTFAHLVCEGVPGDPERRETFQSIRPDSNEFGEQRTGLSDPVETDLPKDYTETQAELEDLKELGKQNIDRAAEPARKVLRRIANTVRPVLWTIGIVLAASFVFVRSPWLLAGGFCVLLLLATIRPKQP